MDDFSDPDYQCCVVEWAEDMLTSVPSLDTMEYSSLLDEIRLRVVNELPFSKTVLQLLNSVSDKIYKLLDGETYRRIVFQDVKFLACRYDSGFDQCFVGTAGATPFDIVTLVCSQTADSDDEEVQNIFRNLDNLFETRPDRPATYMFLFDETGYQIAWADAEVIEYSPLCPWEPEYIHLLFGYLHSIYSPPHTHITVDSSVHSPRQIGRKTTWTIKCAGKEYKNSEVIFQGEPCNRRTTVFKSVGQQDDDFVIIKDYFREEGMGADEADYIRLIHQGGLVPGVVTLVDAVDVVTELDDGSLHLVMTAPPLEHSEEEPSVDRTKQRIVMSSEGVTMWEAESVFDILMGCYDFLELHRWLVEDKGLLYRDVSKNNVRIYPKHRRSVHDQPLVENPPSFIGRVLGIETGDVTIQSSRCMLIDFDNASPLLDETGRPHPIRRYLTGTRPYMARAVNRLAPLPKDEVTLKFARMPRLTPKAEKIYKASYGERTYKKYNDNGTYHGVVLPNPALLLSDDNAPRHCHQPRHDVESVYWLILDTLLRVQPPDAPEGPESLRMFGEAWRKMVNYESMENEDKRNYFMDLTTAQFEQMLHPSLRSLAPMLFKLTKQVSPEYAYMESLASPPEEHLHEAFRRILLQQMVDMEGEDIRLDPSNLRIVPEPDDWTE